MKKHYLYRVSEERHQVSCGKQAISEVATTYAKEVNCISCISRMVSLITNQSDTSKANVYHHKESLNNYEIQLTLLENELQEAKKLEIKAKATEKTDSNGILE